MLERLDPPVLLVVRVEQGLQERLVHRDLQAHLETLARPECLVRLAHLEWLVSPDQLDQPDHKDRQV